MTISIKKKCKKSISKSKTISKSRKYLNKTSKSRSNTRKMRGGLRHNSFKLKTNLKVPPNVGNVKHRSTVAKTVVSTIAPRVVSTVVSTVIPTLVSKTPNYNLSQKKNELEKKFAEILKLKEESNAYTVKARNNINETVPLDVIRKTQEKYGQDLRNLSEQFKYLDAKMQIYQLAQKGVPLNGPKDIKWKKQTAMNVYEGKLSNLQSSLNNTSLKNRKWWNIKSKLKNARVKYVLKSEINKMTKMKHTIPTSNDD